MVFGVFFFYVGSILRMHRQGYLVAWRPWLAYITLNFSKTNVAAPRKDVRWKDTWAFME